MKRRLFGLLFAAVLVPAGGATPGVDAPPLPGAPRPVVVPPIVQHELANGVTVVVAPRHDVPLVTALLLVRAGPEADPAGRAGLAALTATLLARGAVRDGRTVGATTLARQAEALGGALDTGSAWRASTVGMTVSTPKIDPALALMADVVRRPTLAAAELDRAVAQAIDGLRVAMSSPGEVASFALRRAFWGEAAYGTVETPASLARVKRSDVLRFHRRWYRPGHALLVLAGDVTPQRGLTLARRHLGDWSSPGTGPARPQAAQPSPIDASLVAIDMPGSGQSGVAVAAPYVTLASAERRIAQVAQAVLGGGYSARVNQEVRIKRGLSYDARAGAESHEAGGMLVAQAQTDHASAAQVLQLLRGEILRLAREAPAADELAARQAALVGGFARRLETTGGLASLVAGQLINRRPLDELDTYVDEVMAVSAQQVREFAAARWHAEALRGVVAGDLDAAGDALKARASDALVVPLPALDLERPDLVSPAR